MAAVQRFDNRAFGISPAEAQAMDWPQVWEDGEWESPVPQLYAIQRMPTTYLVDRDGRIASKNVRGEAIVTEAVALADRP